MTRMKKEQLKSEKKSETPGHFMLRLVILFVVFLCFLSVLELFYHKVPWEIFRMGEKASADLDFTDIAYQVKNKPDSKEKDIVLVNIATVPPREIRQKLIELILLADSLQPKAIGIDLNFKVLKDSATDRKLDSLFRNKHNLVFGISYPDRSVFPLDTTAHTNIASINLPGLPNQTRRMYYSHTLAWYGTEKISFHSFACKLYEIAYGNNKSLPTDSVFMIHYEGSERGFYNSWSPGPLDSIDHDFPAIDAMEILNNPDSIGSLKKLFKDKIVIVGWLGMPAMDNPYDITDKHRVPIDAHLYNRMPSMPGAAIHANALQMLIRGNTISIIKNDRHKFLLYTVVLFYLAAFMLVEKIHHKFWEFLIETILVLGGSLLLIYTAVAFMRTGTYLQVGEILIDITLLILCKMQAFQLYTFAEEKIRKLYHYIKNNKEKRKPGIKKRT